MRKATQTSDPQDGPLEGALYLAALEGNENNVLSFIARGANLRSELVTSVMLRVIERGHSNILKILLDSGMNPNAITSRTGITPLMWRQGMGD